jgi:uncharacterized protein YegP (UPF0339 family)
MMAGRIEISQAANGEYKFNLKAGNGQVILTSELYKEKRSAIAGAESVKANAADDDRYQRKTASDGSPFFNLTATNGEVIGRSEMYSSESAMENGIASVKTNGPGAEVVDTTE